MMTGLTSGCATCGDTCGPRGVDVIAHRGASAYAPENTLAAFQLAHEMGADWFELDCTLTKDGQVLVIHDDSVERTAGVKRHVSDMTLAELKELDAGSWKDPKYAGERLPTLAEALDLAKGK
ncbi:MAG: glycerophosphodiester phosphodiesterase, partial [Candidatus Hydrogenedentes bacterium]|nr:glycerophosphodiester phosphodiesterase [Candidatus Hydrogenedentota bacterium]